VIAGASGLTLRKRESRGLKSPSRVAKASGALGGGSMLKLRLHRIVELWDKTGRAEVSKAPPKSRAPVDVRLELDAPAWIDLDGQWVLGAPGG
jgi:hypothetical protein